MLHIIIFILKIIGILLLVIFIGSLFVQRFFCRYFCPMGAIYSLISQASFLKIDKPRDGCGKCHLCTSKCPMGMDLTKKDRIAGGECISCQKCVSWCPKGNAHFGIKYGMVIGVLLTCADRSGRYLYYNHGVTALYSRKSG